MKELSESLNAKLALLKQICRLAQSHAGNRNPLRTLEDLLDEELLLYCAFLCSDLDKQTSVSRDLIFHFSRKWMASHELSLFLKEVSRLFSRSTFETPEVYMALLSCSLDEEDFDIDNLDEVKLNEDGFDQEIFDDLYFKQYGSDCHDPLTSRPSGAVIYLDVLEQIANEISDSLLESEAIIVQLRYSEYRSILEKEAERNTRSSIQPGISSRLLDLEIEEALDQDLSLNMI